MPTEVTVPEDAQVWITGEILTLLRAIQPPHVDKKRYTAVRVAIARATPGVPEDSVFKSTDPIEEQRLCARSTWYSKWKHDPEIAAVVKACEDRLRDWRDMETLRVEVQAQLLLRQSIAEGSIDAVNGLRRTALSQKDRADYRTDASKTLLALADEELADRLHKLDGGGVAFKVSGSVEQATAWDLTEVPDDDLRKTISEAGTDGASGEDAGA